MEIEAIVGLVSGKPGNRYAVAYPSEENDAVIPDKSITFSLSDWGGENEPKRGQVVRLSGIERFAKGWRASHAEPVKLKAEKAEKAERKKS